MTKSLLKTGMLTMALLLAASTSGVRGAPFFFSPLCDLSWQTCCDCGASERCNNWGGLPTASPACPAFPTRLDDVIVSLACQVDALPAPGAIVGTLVQSGGAFLLDGSLSVDTTAVFGGPVMWNSGSLLRAQDPGVNITLNGGMTIVGSAGKSLGADGPILGGITLINNGTLTWSDTGDLSVGDVVAGNTPAIIRNSVGSLFDAQSNASILGTAFGTGRIENEGTMQKSAGGGVSVWDVIIFNSGLIHLQSGEIHLTGGGHAAGEFRMDTGTRLVFAPATPFEFLPGVAFNGPGQAALVDTGDSSGIEVRQTVQLNRFSVEDSGQIGPSIEAEFGTMEVTGQLKLSGAVVFPRTHILENAGLIVTGPNTSTVGDVMIAGTAVIGDAQLASNQHAITISSTGVVEMNDGGGLRSAGAAGLAIQNNGILRKSTGAGAATISADADVPFDSASGATIEVASGSLTFGIDIVSRGNVRIGSGATLQALRDVTLDAGVLSGSGTLNGNVIVTGAVVAPGPSTGLLTIAASASPVIAGNYTQGASSTLQAEIGGLNAGSLHDAVHVDGQATLGGTLELTLINGFVPLDGDIVTLVTAGNLIGVFANVNATNLPADTTMQVLYSGTSVVATFSLPGNDNTNNNDNNSNDNNGNNNNNANDNSNTNDNNSNGNGNVNTNDNNSNGNTNDNNSNTNNNGNTNQNDNTDPGPNPIPNAGCGNGTCGTSTVGFLPLMLAGLVARKMRGRRRRLAANRLGH